MSSLQNMNLMHPELLRVVTLQHPVVMKLKEVIRHSTNAVEKAVNLPLALMSGPYLIVNSLDNGGHWHVVYASHTSHIRATRICNYFAVAAAALLTQVGHYVKLPRIF